MWCFRFRPLDALDYPFSGWKWLEVKCNMYNAKQLQFKVFDLLILPFAWFLKGFKPQIVQMQLGDTRGM